MGPQKRRHESGTVKGARYEMCFAIIHMLPGCLHEYLHMCAACSCGVCRFSVSSSARSIIRTRRHAAVDADTQRS